MRNLLMARRADIQPMHRQNRPPLVPAPNPAEEVMVLRGSPSAPGDWSPRQHHQHFTMPTAAGAADRPLLAVHPEDVFRPLALVE